MLLAISTLGCPAWSLEQIARAAVDYGYDGVEIRGIQEHVDLRQSPHFSKSRIGATRRLFTDSGLSISCLGASASFADPDKRAASMDETRAYVQLAAELGCPLVRVFGGKSPDGGSDPYVAVADCLAQLAPFAAEHEVALALETHDAFSTGQAVANVLGRVRNSSIGALWDLHHPYREGETPADTFRLLSPYLLHAHVKDSRDGRYCLLGEGDVPIKEMLALLSGAPQRPTPGAQHPLWLSLEWEKRWHPEIAEPEVAFPQYASKLRSYLEELA